MMRMTKPALTEMPVTTMVKNTVPVTRERSRYRSARYVLGSTTTPKNLRHSPGLAGGAAGWSPAGDGPGGRRTGLSGGLKPDRERLLAPQVGGGDFLRRAVALDHSRELPRYLPRLVFAPLGDGRQLGMEMFLRIVKCVLDQGGVGCLQCAPQLAKIGVDVASQGVPPVLCR